MSPIMALCLYEPYASAVALGLKKIETRGWKTDYRGPLVIHASKNNAMTHGLSLFKYFAASGYGTHIPWPFGCALALCDLVDCVPVEKLRGQLMSPVPNETLFVTAQQYVDYHLNRRPDLFVTYKGQRIVAAAGNDLLAEEDDYKNYVFLFDEKGQTHKLPQNYGMPISPMEYDFGDYTNGRYGFLLENVRPFAHPVPYTGHQKLFEYTGELPLEETRP